MHIVVESERENTYIKHYEFHSKELVLFFDRFFYFKWENTSEKAQLKELISRIEPSESVLKIDKSLVSNPEKYENAYWNFSRNFKVISSKSKNKEIIFTTNDGKIRLFLSKELKEAILNDFDWSN
jgi:hypothetical protein